MEARAVSLWDTHLLSQSPCHQSQCNTKDILFSLTSTIWQTQTDWHSRELYYFLSIGVLHVEWNNNTLFCLSLSLRIFISDNYVRINLISRHISVRKHIWAHYPLISFLKCYTNSRIFLQFSKWIKLMLLPGGEHYLFAQSTTITLMVCLFIYGLSHSQFHFYFTLH